MYSFKAQLKKTTAFGFSALFMVVSFTMIGLAISHFMGAFEARGQDGQFVSGVIRCINDLFIALATYELAMGIFKEYRGDDEKASLVSAIRRTVTRFVSVVIIALVLEGLIMIIKYSQLDLAGNLFYPVAVVFAASILLVALGLFLKWTYREDESRTEASQ